MTETEESRPRGWRGLLRPIVLVVVVLSLLTTAHLLGVGERLGELRDWIASLGAWGPLVYIGLYAAAVVAAIPGSPITVVAAALFGSVLGVAVVSVASTLGATLAFLVARYFARDAVSGWMAKSEKFARLDAMTERHGAIIVAITRLTPLFPFNLLNYGFGLTRVPLLTYVFWSWLCMLPGTVLYIVGADVVFTALAEGNVPRGLLAALVGVVMVIVAVVWWVRRFMKQKEI